MRPIYQVPPYITPTASHYTPKNITPKYNPSFLKSTMYVCVCGGKRWDRSVNFFFLILYIFFIRMYVYIFIFAVSERGRVCQVCDDCWRRRRLSSDRTCRRFDFEFESVRLITVSDSFHYDVMMMMIRVLSGWGFARLPVWFGCCLCCINNIIFYYSDKWRCTVCVYGGVFFFFVAFVCLWIRVCFVCLLI